MTELEKELDRRADIIIRQEKRIAELEEKISVLLSCKNCPENKGGLICAKEYENKCLAQKIEFIKELQKENAELKEQIAELSKHIVELQNDKGELIDRCRELETRCNELFLQTCEQAEKIKELNAEIKNDRDLPAIAYMQGAEKQKKKDEEELQKWKDEWQEQVQKATDEGYARTLQTIQLNKAKKILQKVVKDFHNMDCVSVHISKTIAEAEQFLKGE